MHLKHIYLSNIIGFTTTDFYLLQQVERINYCNKLVKLRTFWLWSCQTSLPGVHEGEERKPWFLNYEWKFTKVLVLECLYGSVPGPGYPRILYSQLGLFPDSWPPCSLTALYSSKWSGGYLALLELGVRTSATRQNRDDAVRGKRLDISWFLQVVQSHRRKTCWVSSLQQFWEVKCQRHFS